MWVHVAVAREFTEKDTENARGEGEGRAKDGGMRRDALGWRRGTPAWRHPAEDKEGGRDFWEGFGSLSSTRDFS